MKFYKIFGSILLGSFIFFLLPMPSISDAANCARCGNVRPADQSRLCYAKCEGSSNKCGLIKNKDLMNYCMAVVRKKPIYCGHIIKNDSLRKKCRKDAR
jgi:hypothetical protein